MRSNEHDDYDDAVATRAIRERVIARLRAEWAEEDPSVELDEDSNYVEQQVALEMKKYGPWPGLSRWWV